MYAVTTPQPDVRDVLWTARLLEITEFEVFRVAYRCWYNKSPGDRFLEHQFVPYIFNGIAPFWVRAFTRRTLDERVPDRRAVPVRFDAPWTRPVSKGALFLLLLYADRGLGGPARLPGRDQLLA